jgi:hypothetical protein
VFCNILRSAKNLIERLGPQGNTFSLSDLRKFSTLSASFHGYSAGLLRGSVSGGNQLTCGNYGNSDQRCQI